MTDNIKVLKKNLHLYKKHFQSIIFEKYLNMLLVDKIKNDYKINCYKTFFETKDILEWKHGHSNYINQIKDEYNSNFFNNDRELLPYGVLTWYTGYFSEVMNRLLRGQINYDNNDFITTRINVLKNEILKNNIIDNIVVIRRVRNEFLPKILKKGSIYSDKGFLSTSIDLTYRKNSESEYKSIYNETLMFIKVPKYTCGIYLEEISKRNEFEIILDKNMNLYIEKKYKILNNQILFARVLN